jgi:spermidine synthase
MAQHVSHAPAPAASPRPEIRSTQPLPNRHLILLLALFAGSGCAALIYEIVWFQLLQLAIGSSAVSLGVLLGTYMGGLCLGSLALPRWISPKQNPLRVYAALEVGIGVLAILVLFGIPLLDQLYAVIATHGLQGVTLRAIVAALCLLPPTLLMGASLPALARWVESSEQGVSWLGFLYGSNIAGAVLGCLLAGFYLLRVYDMQTATFAAAAINFAVALMSRWMSRSASRSLAKPGGEPSRTASSGAARGEAWIYVAIGLSGMTALGAEVIWTRLLSVMIGATVYTFSIILAVFLIGLGIGSAAGSVVGRKYPRAALGVCQLLLAGAIFWTAYALSSSLPYWPINPFLTSSAWFNFQIDLVRCMWAILPAAVLWGASFPLALAAAASPGEDPGQLVGKTYAANTVGAILGALGFSILFIPWIGSKNSERLLIEISVVAALLVLAPMVRVKGTVALAAAAVLAAFAISKVEDVPWLAVAYGRRMLTTTGTGEPLYRGEGRDASVVVSRTDAGAIYFHVSGKVEASTESFDMRLQRMLGHLPALIHPHPRSVLIVGFGAGVTAGTFVVHPEIEKIHICEIEKIIPPVSTRYFNAENYNVLNDPRTQVTYDDARHYVLTTDEKFDIITSDPIHPWVKGTATLYSKEYFELCKRHLNPGGVVTQWVPLYESDPETIKTELATFFEVFPNGTVWANDIDGQGYDVVLLGQNGDARINVDQIQRRIEDNPRLSLSLRQAGFSSAADLMATYAGRARDLSYWLIGAHVNTDMDLRLQYLAGMGLNYNNADAIKQEISKYFRYPGDMFSGSPELLEQIRSRYPQAQ